eukprot:430146_1
MMLTSCSCLLFAICAHTLIDGIYAYRSGPPTPDATLSYWLIDSPFQDLHLGDIPTTVDITIIGAGMSGSSIVYHLIKHLNAIKNDSDDMTNILLIDSRGASGGATGRNGGAMGASGSSTFVSTLNKYGNISAMQQFNFTTQTVIDMKQFINEHNNLYDTIQTGFAMLPINYINIPLIEYEQRIFENYVNKNESRIQEILLKQETEILSHSNAWDASIYSGNSSRFWPAKVVFALINDSILMSNNSINIDEENKVNLNIQFQTTVNSVTSNENDKWDVHIDNYIITSDIVVFATNGYTSYLLPEYSDRIVAAKNQVIMSKEWNYFIWNELLSGFSTDYEYWYQRIEDNKILIGGGRNVVSDNENQWIGNYNDSYIDMNVSIYLQQYLSNLYTEIANSTNKQIEIDVEWQGIMGFSNDGLPWIGPINEENDNRYICAGFTGNGMAYTFNAGKAISDMILGATPKIFADIFLPYYPGRT